VFVFSIFKEISMRQLVGSSSKQDGNDIRAMVVHRLLCGGKG
jgi:hypothetical protein